MGGGGVQQASRGCVVRGSGWGGGGTAQWWTASDSGWSEVLRRRARSAAVAVTALRDTNISKEVSAFKVRFVSATLV